MAQQNVISLPHFVEIEEAAKAVMAYGKEITPIIQGEPGSGKSTILKILEEQYGDKYEYIYVDCPVKDIGDVALNIPVHDTKQLETYVAKLFNLNSTVPKVIMLDEIMKCPKMLQIIFWRLCLERFVGDVPLPKGSVVFATSNNQTDGVGDGMLAHGGNRVMILKMRKPNAKKWNVWATDNDVHPLIRAWVAMNPRCLNSYLELGAEELNINPYIFNPQKAALSFVSCRSLAKCDVIIRNRDQMGVGVTEAALAGTIGQAGAESMAAFFALEKEIQPVRLCIMEPEKTPIPEKPAALFMMMFNAIDEIDTQDDLAGFMKYMDRVKSSEIQALFFTMVSQSRKTVKLANGNARVKKWVSENFNLIV
jgi:hypothetical protein